MKIERCPFCNLEINYDDYRLFNFDAVDWQDWEVHKDGCKILDDYSVNCPKCDSEIFFKVRLFPATTSANEVLYFDFDKQTTDEHFDKSYLDEWTADVSFVLDEWP